MRNPDLFDVCKAHHKGNAQSRKANPGASSKTRDRDAVHRLIVAANGVTSKEIAEAMGKGLNCISGRISELKRNQQIATRGTRDGCSILFSRGEL